MDLGANRSVFFQPIGRMLGRLCCALSQVLLICLKEVLNQYSLRRIQVVARPTAGWNSPNRAELTIVMVDRLSR